MLEILFAAADVSRLATAGYRVVLSNVARDSRVATAWLVLKPRPRITVSWTGASGLYAADTPLVLNEPIFPSAIVRDALPQKTYSYDGSGFRPISDADVPTGHYEVVNESSRAVTLGLLQTAVIDRKEIASPITAAVLRPGVTADFARVHGIRISLVHGTALSGTVVTAPRRTLAITFPSGRNNARVRYRVRSDGSHAHSLCYPP